MTKDDITKAFEGRWRIKGNITSDAWNEGRYDVFAPMIKEVCRDFFEAGITLSEGNTFNTHRPHYKMPSGDDAPQHCLVKESDILTVEDTFNKWWDLYDLKCGKENCMKKWKKLTAKEQFDCIKATPAYVASTPDKQFRKRPLTYLNQKAWNDEIIPRNGTDNKSTIEQQRKSKLTDILVG